eukprot:scaffold101105_cov72-Attheya_sp.AAC.1
MLPLNYILIMLTPSILHLSKLQPLIVPLYHHTQNPRPSLPPPSEPPPLPQDPPTPVPNPPPDQPPLDPFFDPSNSSLRSHHFRYDFNKFRGRTCIDSKGSHIWGPADVINDCIQNNILLLPLTIDPNGMLGPTAQYFLFGTPIDPNFPTAMYLCLTPPCHKAIDSPKGNLVISSILHTANDVWHNKTPDVHNPNWFGASYHTSTPKCWTKFILGLVLWLSASHDQVVVIWEGSFPPWAAAAAARRLVLELWSFVHSILYWDVGYFLLHSAWSRKK